VSALRDLSVTRGVLDALAVRLDGRPAAATTIYRKRAVFYNALGLAVERRLLPTNPIDQVQWSAPEVAQAVDRRVVAGPGQVRALLDAVREAGRRGDHLVAFFGCLYFAGMRPGEAVALRADQCVLPTEGWGRVELTRSEPQAGGAWTDDGEPESHWS
jgi:integrase